MAEIKFKRSLLANAIAGDRTSIEEMFKSFIGEDEELIQADYFGKLGLSFLGTHSFAAISKKRILALQVGPFGQISYQDGYISSINSGEINKPQLFNLYLITIVISCTIIGIVLLPSTIKVYHRLNKSGFIIIFREGLPLYVFADSSKLSLVTSYWRLISSLNEKN